MANREKHHRKPCSPSAAQGLRHNNCIYQQNPPITMHTRSTLRQALNNKATSLVYQFGCGTGTGFCADMTWMMTHLVSCLQFGIGFSLGQVSKPINFCVEEGWTDYFLPFCEQTSGPGLQTLNNGLFGMSRKYAPVRPFMRSFLQAFSEPQGAKLFMFDDIKKLTHLSPPFFTEGQSFMSACQELLELIWEYNPATAQSVLGWRSRYPQSKYIALVIRRGDKFLEHPLVDLEVYTDALGSLPNLPIFVASDDDEAAAQLRRLLPDRSIASLPGIGQKGYDHAHFSKLPANERRTTLERFFAQLEICRDAEFFVGSNTTNVALFVEMLRGSSNCSSVDKLT